MRIAVELFQTRCTDGTPRRLSAPSMTSSWYSDPRCISSSDTATSRTAGVMPSPSWAVSMTSMGRTRLPPAS